MSLPEADRRLRTLAWIVVAAIAAAPVILAAGSPLQRGRELLWITGGMAGVVAMSLLFVQPLLTAASPPLMAARSGLRWHRWGGLAVFATVGLHVGALYAYSPDDVTDALLLRSPTPFSVYGVTGLIGLIITAILTGARWAAGRRAAGLGFWTWRIMHTSVAVVVVAVSAIHALQIESTMEPASKLMICVLAVAAAVLGAIRVAWLPLLRQR